LHKICNQQSLTGLRIAASAVLLLYTGRTAGCLLCLGGKIVLGFCHPSKGLKSGDRLSWALGIGAPEVASLVILSRYV